MDRAKAAGFLQDCPEPTEKDQRALCRKTHQAVLSEVRVIRSCGRVNHTEDCVGSRNLEVVVTSCQCFKDGCNGASAAQFAPLLLAAAAALRAIY